MPLETRQALVKINRELFPKSQKVNALAKKRASIIMYVKKHTHAFSRPLLEQCKEDAVI